MKAVSQSQSSAQTNTPLTNQRGQGLIEYLVIVALMGVATIAIVRVMGQTVSNRFASISAALQGEDARKFGKVDINKSAYQKRDLGNFMDGTDNKGGGSKKSSPDSSPNSSLGD